MKSDPSIKILSDNRSLHMDDAVNCYVNYREYCPRQWFNRREVLTDIALGRAGFGRHYYPRFFLPAVRGAQAYKPDAVLLYEGHYAAPSLPKWRSLLPDSKIVLYVHNQLSRSYGRRELRHLLGNADAVVLLQS